MRTSNNVAVSDFATYGEELTDDELDGVSGGQRDVYLVFRGGQLIAIIVIDY